MNLIPLYAINSTVCGHLIVVWAMALNAVAHYQGGACGAAGVACGAASLVIAWLVSGRVAAGWTAGVGYLYLNAAFTLAAWLLWLVPALSN